MLVSLGKLLDGEEKSKKDDIDIGVHDESGALYSYSATKWAPNDFDFERALMLTSILER